MQDNYNDSAYRIGRQTARGIIIKDGMLLLLERIRPGLHYYSTPGGGIEEGESALQAVQREIAEETSLEVRVERKVYEWVEGTHIHHFFLCSYISGTPQLQPEAEENNNDPDNIHLPRWVSIEEIKKGDFGYWEPIKAKLLHDMEYGFSKTVQKLGTN